MQDIETPRLLLRHIPPAALHAGLSGNRQAVGQSLRANVPSDLIDEPDVLRHAYLHTFVRHAIEFGYAIFAAHRRRGYAEEAVRGLMQWARQAHGVDRFVVTIGPDNAASTHLAAKLGFTRIGENVDPVGGIEYVYLLDLSGRP